MTLTVKECLKLKRGNPMIFLSQKNTHLFRLKSLNETHWSLKVVLQKKYSSIILYFKNFSESAENRSLILVIKVNKRLIN